MKDIISSMSGEEFLKNTNRENKAGTYSVNELALESVFSVIRYFTQNFNSDIMGFSVVPNGDSDATIRLRMTEFAPENLEAFKAMRRKINSIKFCPLDGDMVVEIAMSDLWKFKSGEDLLKEISELNAFFK